MSLAEPNAMEQLRTCDIQLQNSMQELEERFRILASMNGHGDGVRRKIRAAIVRALERTDGSSR